MAVCHPRRRATAAASVDATDAMSQSIKSTSSLLKGATFHAASSTTSGSVFAAPTLPRSQSNIGDASSANRQRIALTLEDIDAALAKTKDLSISDKKPLSTILRDSSLPVPRGFLDLPITDPNMDRSDSERKMLHPRSIRRSSRRHASDSGLGSSVTSSTELAAGKRSSKSRSVASAITRSGAASSREMLPALGPKAVSRIHEHTLRPLLAKPSLKDFEPIVLDIPRRIRSKEIICLRDLEKTLVFMAPEKTKSAVLYLDFCLTSIRCIQATVEYLSDREQIRPDDRPYSNGYFLDLKEQICNYGRQLAASKEGGLEDLDLDQGDEIKLYGGIAENGRPAELIRVKKDGTAISMATGKPVELDDTPIKIKRSLSEQREDEEEIMRSMARRKKNASPEELAPKKCREPGCNKEFKRPCDLTKHEKTHSRPWKCPLPTCKYHEFGWPTEKEMDRHVNDKHSDTPAMYECLFKPCPYKSKRESNCKQHMEKAHGWTYVRTKNNGKIKAPSKPGSSVQHTPPLANASTPSDTSGWSVSTPQENANQMIGDFPIYPSHDEWNTAVAVPTGPIDMDLSFENQSPVSNTSYDQLHPFHNGEAFVINDEDIYAAHAQIPMGMPHLAMQKMMAQQMQPQPYHLQPPVQGNITMTQPDAAPHSALPPHFSPTGQQNAMLYDADENADHPFPVDSQDFPLFPAQVNKANSYQPLFGEVPSANLGFSQTSQPDIFQQVDWSKFPSFSE
jgi:hypothetical protein